MTIASKAQQSIFNVETLRAATYGFNTSFQLDLADNQVFYAEKVVRLVPGKRLVAFGTWLGKAAVIKLFLDAAQSKRHMESELAGIKVLQYNKIPTPTLYYLGHTQSEHLHVLIFERIQHAKNLYDLWQCKNNIDEAMPILKKLVFEIATQHVLGILQQDLHLKNFLLGEKALYSLDGSQIEKRPYILSKKTSMKHLALLLSQLSVMNETYQEALFCYYAKQRGWLLKPEDFYELTYLVKQWNEERVQRYEKKIFRDSTQFARVSTRRMRGMYDREYALPEFKCFLNDPETVFADPRATLLKAGRSATVIKITLDSRELVIKRYNLKNTWHRARRMWRNTRAHQSWQLSQTLNLFGVATAKPIAFVEYAFLGLRGTSYFVSEYVSATHAGHYFSKPHTTEKVSAMVERISDLLYNLQKMGMTHGDLKMTNIIIDDNERPVLIDLDGAKKHVTLSRLRKAWANEITRFLKNFQSEPALLEKFKLALNRYSR